MLQSDESSTMRKRKGIRARIPRSVRTTVVLAGVVVAVAGCASSSKGTTSAGDGGSTSTVAMKDLSMTLNYLPGGAQAGFMYGKSLGLYQKAGINLTIVPGSGSLTTSQLLATGKIDIGYVDAPTAFSVAAKGGNLTVVSPVLQVNGYAIIALQSSGISSVAGLKGKHVAAVAGVAPTVLLPAALQSGGLQQSDINISNIAAASQLGGLITKKFDAIIATGDVQTPQLNEQGQKINTLWYYENGVPTVGESIVVNNDFLKNNPDLVRKFIDVSLQSWVATKNDPAAAAAAENKQFPTEGSVAQQLDQIKADVQLLCAAPGATHMGTVPDSVWQDTESLLKKYNLLPATADYTKYETADYLPANPPSC